MRQLRGSTIAIGILTVILKFLPLQHTRKKHYAR